MPQQLSPDEIKKWKRKIFAASVMRIAGGVFFMLGIAIFSNMFNMARALGLDHGQVHSIFGLFLFMIGIFDMFVVAPFIMRRPKKKKA